MTIADIIGDIDPIKAARGGHSLSDELTMHYGLLPRANRGIFALNELPDLAGKIQVGLFNILQEGDVQIKGYPVRLPLDVLLVLHGEPRGLHGARQDHHAAQGPHRQRDPHALPARPCEHGDGDHRAGGVDGARRPQLARSRDFVREVVEGVAFEARADKRIDKRSGVSPAPADHARSRTSCSNAERRALRRRRDARSCRASPTSTPRCRRSPASSSSSTRASCVGAEDVARELIREAVGEVFSTYLGAADLRRRWCASSRRAARCGSATAPRRREVLAQLRRVPEVLENLAALGVDAGRGRAALAAAAGEFVLEGLWAQKKIGRSDDRGFVAPERRADVEVDLRAPRAAAPAEEAGELRPMAVVRYHRYTGELWDDLDLEALVDELSDFLLQTGFAGGGSQSYSAGCRRRGSDRSLEALHDAILDALMRERAVLAGDARGAARRATTTRRQAQARRAARRDRPAADATRATSRRRASRRCRPGTSP